MSAYKVSTQYTKCAFCGKPVAFYCNNSKPRTYCAPEKPNGTSKCKSKANRNKLIERMTPKEEKQFYKDKYAKMRSSVKGLEGYKRRKRTYWQRRAREAINGRTEEVRMHT